MTIFLLVLLTLAAIGYWRVSLSLNPTKPTRPRPPTADTVTTTIRRRDRPTRTTHWAEADTHDVPTWTALDDHQLTRLLTQAAPARPGPTRAAAQPHQAAQVARRSGDLPAPTMPAT